MAQRQRAQTQRLVDGLNAQRRRRITGMVVMVAAHQQQVQRRMLHTPLRQRLQRGRRVRMGRMQQVAEKDHATSTADGDGLAQPLQRLRRGAFRHRHALAAERGRLADVRVGHQQAPVIEQAGRTLRQQRQALAGNLDLQHQALSRRSARSRCSVGKRLKPERA